MTWLIAFLTIMSLLVLDPSITHRGTSLSTRAEATAMQKDIHGNVTPPARDPKLAVEEEYQSALQQGTVQALQIFITRHPDSPLAEKALDRLQRLSR